MGVSGTCGGLKGMAKGVGWGQHGDIMGWNGVIMGTLRGWDGDTIGTPIGLGGGGGMNGTKRDRNGTIWR